MDRFFWMCNRYLKVEEVSIIRGNKIKGQKSELWTYEETGRI